LKRLSATRSWATSKLRRGTIFLPGISLIFRSCREFWWWRVSRKPAPCCCDEKIGKDHKNKHLLAYQVRGAQFLAPILPGDRIKYRVQLLGFYDGKIANFTGEASVGGALKCEVRFSVAVMDKSEMKEKFLKPATAATAAARKEYFSLPPLVIGGKTAKYPIIQGGMAVRVSLHNLAGNVAKNGGVGIVAISGMMGGEEVKSEIRQARAIAGPDGVIGVNIMGVIGRFERIAYRGVGRRG